MLFHHIAIQDGIITCLIALFLVALMQLFFFLTIKRAATMRPLYDVLLDIIFTPIISRLNRRYRKKGDLVFRGSLVLMVMCCVTPLFGYAEYMLKQLGYDLIYIHVLFLSLFLSVSTPFLWGLRLVKHENNQVFHALSRAGYANLIHHDQHGLYRYSIKLMIVNFVTSVITPILLYLVFGIYAVLIAASCVSLMNIAGRQDYGGTFSAIAKLVASPAMIIGNILAKILVVIAVRFTLNRVKNETNARAEQKPQKKNALWEGGKALSSLAINLGATLGGPYQDRYAHPVAAPWVGYVGDSSKIKKVHVMQSAYTIAVATLLFVLCLSGIYVLANRLM